MALNQNNYEFVNNLLYVDGVKFHRGKFIKESWIQHWDCARKKTAVHVKTGNLAAKRLPEASNILDDFPNRAVPLRNFRNRIFTNTDASLGELQSTKHRREEEDTLTSSKRTKLDSTSQKSVCLVHFKLKKIM